MYVPTNHLTTSYIYRNEAKYILFEIQALPNFWCALSEGQSKNSIKTVNISVLYISFKLNSIAIVVQWY